ncbi:sulfotransferase family protein [Flammeovirgaceae bacterium SG7u.111]|nr:sulfotransferase family protein [Flammeovirgaceae bacterium SG7u.132]WPO36595.1 sulfotransferase family protein [Flammeovirgaceae bacterium SG7u.111]
MNKTPTKRICLWSGPRNISTALMYSFAQRNDTQVFDEPLYAHYLSQTAAKEYHPGAEEILATMENDGQKVVEMMMGEQEKPVVFFKNMTHHLLGLDKGFMKDAVNVMLTRDPVEMLPSFGKVIENPSMLDVGYELHAELLDYFEENGITPIVLESKRLLLDPEGVLKRFCKLAEIPFERSMLQWEAGARPEDGSWAKYWYASVHQSTRFAEYKPKTEPFPERLKPLLAKCQPYYERLMKLAI